VALYAAGAAELLDCCGMALEAAAPVLLDAVLAAAQDDWPDVAAPARAWLAGKAMEDAPAGAQPCSAMHCGGCCDVASLGLAAASQPALPDERQLHLQWTGSRPVQGNTRNLLMRRRWTRGVATKRPSWRWHQQAGRSR